MNSGIFGMPGSPLNRLMGVVRPLIGRFLPAKDSADRPQAIIEVFDRENEIYPYKGIGRFDNHNSGIDLVLGGQRGTGSIQAHAADQTNAGGNTRGEYAVDWQTKRDLATQVASGRNSVISGGANNTASGETSIICGGENNSATNTQSLVIGGLNNTSSDRNAINAGGENNICSGASFIGGGKDNLATSFYSSVFGKDALGDFPYAFFIGSEKFTNTGDCQFQKLILSRQTTDGSLNVLTFANNTPGSTSNTRFIISANTQYTFTINIIATQSAGTSGTVGDSAWWTINGAIKRDGSNNTTLVGVNSVLTDYDAGAASWIVNIVANDTIECLDIEVTGEIDKTIRWVATIDATKVGYY
jgi:hypothetical protein